MHLGIPNLASSSGNGELRFGRAFSRLFVRTRWSLAPPESLAPRALVWYCQHWERSLRQRKKGVVSPWYRAIQRRILLGIARSLGRALARRGTPGADGRRAQ